MAVDTLGLIACIFFLSSEVSYSRERPNPSKWLGLLSVFFFLCAGRIVYVICGLSIAVLGTAIHWILRKTPDWNTTLTPFMFRLLVGFNHAIGLFVGPFLVWYGYTGCYDDSSQFMRYEAAHLVLAFFCIVVFSVYPLFVHTSGYWNFTLEHQRRDSIYEMIVGTFVVVLLVSIHFIVKYVTQVKAIDIEHWAFGLIFAASGFLSFNMAAQGMSSDIGMVLPILHFAYQLSNHHHGGEVVLVWKVFLIKIHKLAGVLMGVSGLCRIVKRRHESMIFAHMSIFMINSGSSQLCMFWSKFYAANFVGLEHTSNAGATTDSSMVEMENKQNMEDGDEVARCIIPLIIIGSVFSVALQYCVLGRLRKTVDPDFDPKQKRRNELISQFDQVLDLDLRLNESSEENEEITEAVALTGKEIA